MLSSAYRLKRIRKINQREILEGKTIDNWKEINEDRSYRNHMMAFQKTSRQIRNINDPDADMEALKNELERVVKDIDVIRMSLFMVYNDIRYLKKRTKKKTLRNGKQV